MKIINLIVFILFIGTLYSQPSNNINEWEPGNGPPPWAGGGKPKCVPPPCVPIDNQIIPLAILMMGYGVYKFKKLKTC